MLVKIKVPPSGNIKTYINKPITDRRSFSKFDDVKEIGKIVDAKEVDSNYELTLDITDLDLNIEFNSDRVRSISIDC